MASTRYVPNHKGIAELLVSPDMAEVMLAETEAAKEYAISTSPRGDTGNYSESFTVDVDIRGDRVTGVLTNTADYAHIVEWGAYGYEGEHVLSRTVDWIEHS